MKYSEIWNKVKGILNIKLHGQPIYDDKYKTTVKTFNHLINTLFSGNEIPKQRIHYICISALCIDSILRVDKKNYPQVYLEQEEKVVSFIDDEVNLSSDDSDDDKL